MAYTLAKANKLALDIFKRETDWTGVPYMDHLEVVRDTLEMYDEDLQVIGVLHSVLEHTDWTAETLALEGLPDKAVETLVALRHDRKKQTHAMYFRQVRNNEDATLVKIACVAHNYRPERLRTSSVVQRSERVISQGFCQRHLWTAAYEDDLRDILAAVHPELLSRVDELKKENKL